jgi:hypothetical protein
MGRGGGVGVHTVRGGTGWVGVGGGTLGVISSSSVISSMAPSLSYLHMRAGPVRDGGLCRRALFAAALLRTPRRRRTHACEAAHVPGVRGATGVVVCCTGQGRVGAALPAVVCGGEDGDQVAAREVLVPPRHALVRAHLRRSVRARGPRPHRAAVMRPRHTHARTHATRAGTAASICFACDAKDPDTRD